VSAPGPWLVAAAGHQEHEEHAEHEGHSHTSTAEWLSMGLWSGLALALVAALVLGLVLGARVIRRRAASHVPCRNCGTYVDPGKDRACPSCGRALKDE
jgi:hypothetical protein